MRFLIILCLIATSCTSRGNKKDIQKASYYLEIGTNYLKQNNPRPALQALLSAEKLDPDNSVIQNNLGVTYFALGKYDLAYAHVKNAVRINSAYTDARNNLGGILIEVGKYSEAINELERCLGDLTYISPEKIHMNLGLAYFRSGNYTQALGHLKKTLELRREHCQAMTYYGRTNYELKEYKIAAQSLDQAVYYCREIKFDEPYFFSGLSFLRLGNRERAAARFDEVIKLYPEGSYASKARALLDNLQ